MYSVVDSAHQNIRTQQQKLIYNRYTARYWRPVLVTSPRNGGPEHQLLSEHQASPNTHTQKIMEREREICAYIALESSFIVDLKHRQTRE